MRIFWQEEQSRQNRHLPKCAKILICEILEELPERYRRYEDELWHSRGMRVLPIDNFVILYIPYLEEKVVRIVAVMYGGRDIGEQLKKI